MQDASVFVVPISQVSIPEDRQRTDLGDLTSLKHSLLRRGQLNPIIVRPGENGYVLVAGERRLRAMQEINHQTILVRLFESLDPAARELVELEENIHRKDLDWKEMVRAVHKFHQIKIKSEPEWTVEQTAQELGFSQGHTYLVLRLHSELSNPKVLAAESLRSAINVMERELERKVNNELSQISAIEDEEPAEAPGPTPGPAPGSPAPILPGPRPAEDDILVQDFTEWAPKYSGPKFNFLHCDFPYGINHQKSDQGGSARLGSYADHPDIYWSLVHCLLTNQDRILFPSAHAIFWFSMNYYTRTVELFKSAGWFVVPHPLIWVKSDGKGIASDVERRPRHCYETALFMSRGDRKIISPVADFYSAPTVKTIHQSEKPEPVLRHFFRLCCDGLSELLDPTAGSGSALRAAEALGAKRVLGLELNPEYAESARAALNRSRQLASLQRKLNA